MRFQVKIRSRPYPHLHPHLHSYLHVVEHAGSPQRFSERSYVHTLAVQGLLTFGPGHHVHIDCWLRIGGLANVDVGALRVHVAIVTV